MARSYLGKIFRSGYSLPKVAAKTMMKFFKFAIKQLLLEMSFAVLVIGFSYLFNSWGLPLNAAFAMAIAMTLCLICLLILALSLFSESNPDGKSKVEVKLARRIGQILANRTSTEWNEYQDWLHDIMLSRQQLLNANYPRWQVKLITYRRLSAFCLIIVFSRIKQVTAKMWRSR